MGIFNAAAELAFLGAAIYYIGYAILFLVAAAVIALFFLMLFGRW